MVQIIRSLRVFAKYKFFISLSILSLTIGITSTFLVLIWVGHEMSYDTFHQDRDRLHRVLMNIHEPDGTVYTNKTTAYPLRTVLEQQTGIDATVQLTLEDEFYLIHDKDSYKTKSLTASPNFFSVMGFDLLEGNSQTVLSQVNSVVISKRLANKLFQGQAVGNTLQLFTVNRLVTYQITGVFADVPDNSSLQFDAVVPLEAFLGRHAHPDNWGNQWLFTYVKVAEGYQGKTQQLEQRMKNSLLRVNQEFNFAPVLQPIANMHLYNAYTNGINTGGRIDYIRLVLISLALVIIISIINYSNLILTLSYKRGKEIGMKRILGIKKSEVFITSLVDSSMLMGVALLLGTGLVLLLLPEYNALVGLNLGASQVLTSSGFVATVVVALILAAILSVYPSVYFWSVKPLDGIRNQIVVKGAKLKINELLLAAQFALTTGLLVFTSVVNNQIDSVYNKPLGFEQAHVMVLLMDEVLYSNLPAVKAELGKLPFLSGVGASSFNFGFDPGQTGDLSWTGKGSEYDQFSISALIVDNDFTKSLNMQLVQGRSFAQSGPGDLHSFLISESAAKALPFDDPLNKTLHLWGKQGKIVGIVKDFNYKPLYHPIEPVVLQLDPDECEYLFLKSGSGFGSKQIAQVNAALRQFSPYYAFDYDYLQSIIERPYRSDVVLEKIFGWGSVVITLISCLGLYSFSAFAIQRYQKDIGIRKVFGSSIANIFLVYTYKFLKMVVVAVFIAMPVAFYLGQRWLNSFSYRSQLSADVFLYPFSIIMLLAISSVASQVILAGRANPLNILRHL